MSDERCNECGRTDPMFCGKRFCPLVEAMRHPGPPPAASHHSAAHVAGSDPAPSPSIPDPSDERTPGYERLTTGYSWGLEPNGVVLAGALDRQPQAEAEAARRGLGGEVVAALWDRIDAAARAARPTSLPEAPEPGTRETLCLRCKAGAGRHGGAVGFICGVCLAPSAPPVAVDPEAGAGAGEDDFALTESTAAMVEDRTCTHQKRGDRSDTNCPIHGPWICPEEDEPSSCQVLGSVPAARRASGDGEGTGNDG